MQAAHRPLPGRIGQKWLWAALLAWVCVSAAWAQSTQPTATVTVERGDTAITLAQRLRPEGASLEQTLVALWRLNPRAFGDDNINQLLQGAVLRVPTQQDILHTPARQAHRIALSHVDNLQRYVRQHQASSATAAARAPAVAQVSLPADAQHSAAVVAHALAQAQSLKALLEGQNKDTELRLLQLEKSIKALHDLQAAPAAVSAPAPHAAAPAVASSAAATPAPQHSAAPSDLAAAGTPPAVAAASEAAQAAAAPAQTTATDAHTPDANAPVAQVNAAGVQLPWAFAVGWPLWVWMSAMALGALALAGVTLRLLRKPAVAKPALAPWPNVPPIPAVMASIDLNLDASPAASPPLSGASTPKGPQL